MKTIGLLGGMSWESTQSYYQLLNEGVKEALGGLHSAKCILYSVDFAEIEQLQHAGDWDQTAILLANAANKLELAGADCLLICTNTMHKVAPEVQAAISIPLLHIADRTGKALKDQECKKVGLLGTAFTMEQAFYKQRLEDNFGLEVLVPNDSDRQLVHQIIYQELCLGVTRDHSRNEYLRVIDQLKALGAEAIILGCTEIGLLVQQQHTSIPLLDTTALHAAAAVEFALGENQE